VAFTGADTVLPVIAQCGMKREPAARNNAQIWQCSGRMLFCTVHAPTLQRKGKLKY